ncbi:MAG: DMT family transporter [Actinomycetota bacterium]|nr:DMT family transporter [Actinomycetota bacterium]
MTSPEINHLAPPPQTVPAPRGTADNWTLPAAVLVVLVLWASAFIAIRAVGDTFAPGPLALGRMTVGTIALGVVALKYRRPFPRGNGLLMVATYGVLWFAGYTVVLNTAERHLDAGTAAMLVNIAPILVAVAAGLFMAEGFPRPLVLGIVVAFAGVLIIAVGGAGVHSDGLGMVLGIVTAVLYAAGVLTQKIALRTVDAVSATWVGCAVGTIALTPFLPQAVHQYAHASGGAIAAVVYLGIFPTAIAFSLWAYALSASSAGRLTSTTLAVPAIVVLMSWILLGEVPTLFAMAGGALCLLGVAISRRKQRAGKHAVAQGEQPCAATAT